MAKKTQGILLIAIGNQGYAYMAYNMAYSIKRLDFDAKIHLLADGCVEHIDQSRRRVFDSISAPEPQDYMSDKGIDPGKLKTRLYKYLPFDETLYLDVDGLAMQPITPRLKAFALDERWFITSEQGRGKQTEKINYSEWASNETIANHFKLDAEQDLVAIQSSWAFIRKCAQAKKFYEQVAKAFDLFDIADLNINWGGTKPDELFFSGMISKYGLSVDGPKDMIFFGTNGSPLEPHQIEGKYAILSVYGKANGRMMTAPRFWEYYDASMYAWTRSARPGSILANHHIYKATIVKQYKHANKQVRQ